MLDTKPLLSIFHKINHAAPITQQESRRLLQALTASFRKNLDKEHGCLSQDTPSPPSLATTRPTGSSSASVLSSTSSAAAALSSSRPGDVLDPPADRHVRAILSNPLFSYDPNKATSKPSDHGDAMDIFDQAVSKGLMTPDRAAGILLAHRHSVTRNLCTASLPGAEPGLRVVQWLRSSGLERDLSFITCHRLVKNLVGYMIQERLEEIVWIWLDKWMRGEGPVMPIAARIHHAANLLSAVVLAKTTPCTNLDSGYVSMVRADDMFSHLSEFQQAAILSWRYLSAQSIRGRTRGRPQPSEALFDSFAAVSQHLRPHAALDLHRAHLDLHHPTHPDATLAIDYLKSPQPTHLDLCLKQEIERGMLTSHHHTSMFRKLIVMAIDTAGHLASTGRQADAEWVRNLIQSFWNTQVKQSLHYLPPVMGSYT